MFTISANSPRVPSGMRVYAVGDIHGRLDLLDALLDQIEAYETAHRCNDAKIVFLGDYIDRGPDSSGVIERLLSGLPDGLAPYFLSGNHEAMMLRCREDPAYFSNWAMNGGLATLASYGVDASHAVDAARALAQLWQRIPERHLAFMRGLKIWAALGDYFFVHAGVRPGVPLEAQAEEDCLFIREAFLRYRGDFGKIVVHGHTPVREPEILPNRIGIDTGAFFTGRLTALRLEGESREFLTAAGQGRQL